MAPRSAVVLAAAALSAAMFAGADAQAVIPVRHALLRLPRAPRGTQKLRASLRRPSAPRKLLPATLRLRR
jgi:hypothetical protein